MRGHINEVTLIGTVCRNPIPKLVEKGQLRTTFGVVTEQEFRTTRGKLVREEDYHEVVVWGQLANLCAKNLVVGRLIYLRGRSHMLLIKDEQSGQSYRVCEVVGETIKFLDSRPPVELETAASTSELLAG